MTTSKARPRLKRRASGRRTPTLCDSSGAGASSIAERISAADEVALPSLVLLARESGHWMPDASQCSHPQQPGTR